MAKSLLCLFSDVANGLQPCPYALLCVLPCAVLMSASFRDSAV